MLDITYREKKRENNDTFSRTEGGGGVGLATVSVRTALHAEAGILVSVAQESVLFRREAVTSVVTATTNGAP